MSKNPNTNCLEGMRCPGCHSYGPFDIAISATVTVSDDGTDSPGDTYWDDESDCECPECSRSGKVKDFREENQIDTAADFVERLMSMTGNIYISKGVATFPDGRTVDLSKLKDGDE